LNMAENCQAVMPTGNLLLVVNPSSFSGTYTFYEFNTLSGFIATPAGGPNIHTGNVYQTPLPDGTVFVTSRDNPTAFIYTPAGAQIATGKPNITSIGGFTNGQYTVMGTALNGLTNGANRDDEGQNFTSFPTVQISSSGKKYYGSVVSLSTMSIAPNAPGVVQFTMPSTVAHADVTTSVSASGWQSANSVVISNNLWLPSPAEHLLAM